ncbi:cupin domain-containing protein [Sphingomonas sp. KR1UV-12]|uniref:Cupin domain-containing protein n=1 Tax=Sphingomonas aurea TaxID=3063994 RepID=A0ABT9EF38_9SPHN|nr:cupin domain-containing protein [Sphingomonas sp. KR1UV-12]MDP1025586.1 cupin domain-containing protein [Sphingomonas sp. KR1UV-12]
MPKIDVAIVPVRTGSTYPAPYDEPCRERMRQRLGEAGGLTAFGANLTQLPPGGWSSQRHWHSHEDEFVYVLRGELVLIEDEREVTLRAGDCAAFPGNSGDGHHLVNRSAEIATYLEVGSRHPDDLTTCSDIDLMSANRDGRFMRKDGSAV